MRTCQKGMSIKCGKNVKCVGREKVGRRPGDERETEDEKRQKAIGKSSFSFLIFHNITPVELEPLEPINNQRADDSTPPPHSPPPHTHHLHLQQHHQPKFIQSHLCCHRHHFLPVLFCNDTKRILHLFLSQRLLKVPPAQLLCIEC